jgi:hypothetical protein
MKLEKSRWGSSPCWSADGSTVRREEIVRTIRGEAIHINVDARALKRFLTLLDALVARRSDIDLGQGRFI